MTDARPVGIREALRRVVVGFRAAAAVWVLALTAVALIGGPGQWQLLVAAAVTGFLWALVVIWLGQRRSDAMAAVPFLVADTVVTSAIIVASFRGMADPHIYGAYPFSAVLLAAYVRGYAGGLTVGAALTAVTIAMSPNEGAVTSTFIYLVGAAVAAWSMEVLRRADDRQQRLAAQLADERTERARADERAEAANALHDSVLQTLALIQRRRDNPDEVASLARRGERELRRWVLGGTFGGDDATLADAVERLAAEVEQTHHLTVSVVTVGDHPLDERTGAVLAAAREALTNAAKHAGVGAVAVYAEATNDEILVTVRDRGVGFDPLAVPDDRSGISSSIIARLERLGGRGVVTSRPGAGTEVELVLPVRVSDAASPAELPGES